MSQPTSAGGQPSSFKTNVNRAKTQRWVEAKSYSYDGDDWGDVDDYDEYGAYPEPPPAPTPKPTGLRQRGQSATQRPEDPYGNQAVYESPIDEERGGYGNLGAHHSQQPQNQGGRSVTNRPPPLQTNMQRSNSFDRGDERRAFSAGDPHQPNEPAPPYTSHSMPQGQPTQVHVSQPGQSFQTMQPEPPRRPVEMPHRPSMESQFRAPGQSQPASGTYGGVPNPEQLHAMNARNRAGSSTSNNSSLDFHNRRDFSPSAMPQPLQKRGSPSPNSDSRGSSVRPPRKSSLGQDNQPSLPFVPQPPPLSGEDNLFQRERSDSGVDKPLPFLRPADIYRRMHEEKEKERQSQESARPSLEHILGKPMDRPSLESKRELDSSRSVKPTLDPVTERKSEYGMEGLNMNEQTDNNEKRRTTSKTFEIKKPTSPPPSQAKPAPRTSLGPMLPDVARVSGFGDSFGDSFMGSSSGFVGSTLSSVSSSASPPKQEQEPSRDATKIGGLQKQPSKGFTSAVHQSFDMAEERVPPTPSSTADSSLDRSASGGTSAVSPIISRGPSAIDQSRNGKLHSIDDVTNPMEHDDGESSNLRPMSSHSLGTPTQTKSSVTQPAPDDQDEMPPPSFKPGHRRDMSTPSPDNSPARTPALEMNRRSRPPQEVELAETTPTPTDSDLSATNSFSGPSRVSVPDDAAQEAAPTGIPRRLGQPSTPSSPSQSFLPGRTYSSGSGRVRNLADKFENTSRPPSSHSNTTPRASMLPQGTQARDDLPPPRPLNDRMESFRPHLPGGWESSASIAPRSAPDVAPLGDNRHTPLQQRSDPIEPSHQPSSTQEKPSSISQIKDASDSAFTAVAEAGTALAGALAAAVGMEHEDPSAHDESRDQDLKHTGVPSRDRTSSINTVVHPEASRPQMPHMTDDEDLTAAPTPLPKDTPRLTDKAASGPDYFSGSANQGVHHQPDSMESDAPASTNQRSPLPALTTDMKGPGEQYDSDRLRREIARELGTSEPTTAASDSPYQGQPSSVYSPNEPGIREGRESGVLPSAYESYWNDDNSDDASSTFSGEPGQVVDATTAQRQQCAALIGKSPDPGPANVGTFPESVNKTDSMTDRPHVLPHRFSWEQPLQKLAPPAHVAGKPAEHNDSLGAAPMSDFLKSAVYPEGHEAQPQPDTREPHLPEAFQQNLPMEGAVSAMSDAPREVGSKVDNADSMEAPELAHPDTSGEKELPTYPGGLEVMQPSSEKQTAGSSPTEIRHPTGLRDHSPASQQEVREEPIPSIVTGMPSPARTDDLPLPPPNAQPKIPAFREILALKTPQARIQAYNETRDQFANLNTGLAHWLAMTANNMPEHADILSNQGRTGSGLQSHRNSPSRSKFLNSSPHSAGPSSATPSATAGYGPSQGFSPSGGSGGKISSQQVQAKSKEFLHTAGVFGGKANVAAKGLFSKGKSKLKSSGADKASYFATPPSSAGQLTRGMQSDRKTFDSPSSARDARQPAIDRTTFSSPETHTFAPANAPESEQDTPSVESFTQSQLGDDEQSDESIPEITSRPPRSFRGHTSGSAGSEPHVGTPKSKQSSRSHTSSNKTPTQATFDHAHPNTSNVPLAPERTESPQDLRRGAVSEHVPETSSASQYVAAADRQQLPHNSFKSPDNNQTPSRADDSRRSSSDYYQANPVARHRLSKWSALDTSGREKINMQPDLDEQKALHSPNDSPGQGPPKMTDGDTHLASEIAESSSQDPLAMMQNSNGKVQRPFSNDEKQRTLGPSQDLTSQRVSIGSISSRIDPDQSPSPVSPQQPMHKAPEERGRSVVPIHHGVGHDFGPESDAERARRRSPSFSRPFHNSPGPSEGNGPDMQARPASRQGAPTPENIAMPAHFYPGQAPEYALEESRQADIPSPQPNSRSRRSSISSAFFKVLSNNAKSDTPQVPNAADSSPTSAGRKSKRSSIFSSRKSNADSPIDNVQNKENITPQFRSSTFPIAPSYKAPPSVRQEEDDEFPQRPTQRMSNRFSRQLQRASTSVQPQPKPGSGKKTRFSALGSLFGRSSPKRQNSKEPPRMWPDEAARGWQQRSPPTQQQPYESYSMPSAPPQGSPENHSTVPHPAQPPYEGYYAPGRDPSGSPQPSTHPSEAQTRVHQKMTQSGLLPGRRADGSAYSQDSSLRAQKSPPPPSSSNRSSRLPSNIFRGASSSSTSTSLGPPTRPTAPHHQSSKDPTRSPQNERQPSTSNAWQRLSARARSRSRSRSQAPPEPTLSPSTYTSPHPNIAAVQQPSRAPRTASPPPPPPPPKDDWHRAQPRTSSIRTSIQPLPPPKTTHPPHPLPLLQPLLHPHQHRHLHTRPPPNLPPSPIPPIPPTAADQTTQSPPAGPKIAK